MLREAGWYPGRSVSTAGWEELLDEHGGFEIHPAARTFLMEFGGLAVEHRGPGITMVRADFQLDPALAKWDEEIFEALSELCGSHLYPLGASEHRNNYIGMAPDGSVYLGMDDVRMLAETGDKALEKLVEGIR
ncbi:hypothetical protein EBN88_29870 [Streptomyces triticirhizae]|uniref:SUKH-3 domain containing protein n=1 Tax=Streptomyces triticirhizae TaxID=2483353 RepID=A0A3M2KMI7_9ACTN|nr:hypothetical protein EBN88_29870 [Streptomyces triticirhizae]